MILSILRHGPEPVKQFRAGVTSKRTVNAMFKLSARLAADVPGRLVTHHPVYS